MDERADEEVLLGDGFDERKALEELERLRREIVRYQAVREGVNEEFERFVQSFKKPQSARPAAAPHSAPAPPPAPAPVARAEEPQTRPPARPPAVAHAPSPVRISEPEPVRVADPPIRVQEAPRTTPPDVQRAAPLPRATPEPVVPPVPIQPASAQFEPLNLEPFIKEPPVVEATPPSGTHRVPTSPEAFAAPRDEDDDEAFAPGADFDALPPPLEPVSESLPSVPPPVAQRPSSRRAWVVLGSMIAVVAGGGYVWTLRQSDNTEPPASNAQPAAANPPAPAAPSAPSERTAQAQGALAAATQQSEIVTTQPAWIRVTADGERVLERELPANSRIPFTAEKTIQIRTGNAGAVRLSIRGVDQGVLGGIGEVVTRSFTVTR